jgi:hypothetical protein
MPRDLIRTGYEEDEAWVRMLDGVDVYTQDYKDAGPGVLRSLETSVRFWLKTQRYLRELKA